MSLKTFGTPASLPPSGAAGGSLAGTYPNPSIATNVSLPGSPTTTTQSAGDNSTKVSTTAFVTTAVNNAIAGTNPAIAVQAATTTAANTSGLTYNNGVAGVGATFTGSVNTALTIDGYTFTAVGQRLLVKNDTQSPSGAFNGIYDVTQIQTAIAPPILTRALDYNTPTSINNTGAIPVVNGTVNTLTSWLLTSQVTTIGTDALTYTQFEYSQANVAITGGTINGTTIGATTAASGKFTTLASSSQYTNTVITGSAPFIVSSTTRVSNLNVASAGNADTVTTNANLTGVVTSVGNATAIANGAITNAMLTNSSLTINGSSVSLGGSTTVTATATSALTIGSGLSGTSYNGSSPITIAIASGGVSNAMLANSSLTVNGTSISLGASGTVTASTTNALTISSGLTLNSGSTFDGSAARTLSVGTGNITNTMLAGSITAAKLVGTDIATVGTVTAGTWSSGLAAYYEPATITNTGSTYTIDLSSKNAFKLTLNASCTFTFSGAAASGNLTSFTLYLKQDGTGGWTTTWPGSVDWSGGTPPTLTTTASHGDLLAFLTFDGGTNYIGVAGPLNYTGP